VPQAFADTICCDLVSIGFTPTAAGVDGNQTRILELLEALLRAPFGHGSLARDGLNGGPRIPFFVGVIGNGQEAQEIPSLARRVAPYCGQDVQAHAKIPAFNVYTLLQAHDLLYIQ